MLAYLLNSWQSTFELLADSGYGLTPIAGITYDQVLVKYQKMGGEFVEKTMNGTNWIERGEGFYSIVWSPEDLDTIGSFIFTVAFPYQTKEYQDRFTVIPEPIQYGVPAPTCVVTGNIVDIGGLPMSATDVVFRPPHVPSFAGPSLVASGIIRTMTDAFGNFSVRLLRNTSVLVEIEKAGIRYLISIPDEPTAQLLDLLPPLPPAS